MGMNREQAISYLISSGFSEEQVSTIAKAFEPTTKNDLGVDAISRAEAQTEIEMNASRYTIAKERGGMGQVEWSDQLIKVSDAVDIIRHLPSVTPQLSSGLEKNSKKLEKDFGELDCISRQAVIDSLYDWSNHSMTDAETWHLRQVIGDIKSMPSVTPQERKGHWIGIDEEPHEDYECDKCGYIISTYTANLEPHTEYKYCPSCGARMIEPQESEDKE